MQAYVLSRFHSLSETIPQDGKDEIPTFNLEIVNAALEFNQQNYETYFICVQYAEVDEFYAAMESPVPTYYNFKPIGIEENLHGQIHDHFCSEIHRKLN